MEEQPQVKARTDPENFTRYLVLKKLGQDIFTGSNLVNEGTVSEDDVILSRKFVAQAITETSRTSGLPVRGSWIEHTLIAPELGRKLAEAVKEKGVDLNPQELEFSLYLHDISILFNFLHLKRDLDGDALQLAMGVPKEIVQRGFSLPSLARSLIKGTSPEEFFESLSPLQRLHFLTDNIGKLTSDGKLFTLEAYYQYLDSYVANLQKRKSSPWPSVNMDIEAGQINKGLPKDFGRTVIDKTVEWLESLGVDQEEIRKTLVEQNYGPKFIIVAENNDGEHPRALQQILKAKQYRVRNFVTPSQEPTREDFWQTAKSLHAGETEVWLTEKDPLTILDNCLPSQNLKSKEPPENIQYPNNALGVVIGSDGKLFTYFFL